MDPLTALLFSLWIAGYFTRNVYEDVVFKARGEDPPSYRRQQQRWERQKERRDRGPGPARKFMGNVWADAWAQADERRARRVEKAAQRRLEPTAEKDAEKGKAAGDETNATKERVKNPEKPASPPPPAPPADPIPADPKGAFCPCDTCNRSWNREVLVTRYISGYGTLWVCPACAGDLAEGRPVPLTDPQRNAPAQPQPAPAQPKADPPPVSEPAPPPPVKQADDAQSPPDDAQIIQFADWQQRAAEPTSKEKNMSAEITGLRSAIAFAEGSSTSATEAVTQTELAITNLQAGGTSGPAIDALQQAMDQLTAAAGAFQAAQRTLTDQLQVTEAYAANQGAGSREFVKSE